ncbi:MAG: VirB3 family type IV secretion system protein [Alphaproteobacteria bacterium]|nr:VirB3 family type IV secretion system protein [Alphaproteobacteria bacterium]
MSRTAPPEGFEVPLHRALTEPILLAGVPRSLAILNGTFAAAVGLGLQQWVAGLMLWLILQAIGVFCARHDPQFMDVLARHLRHRNFHGC